jgi:Ger(x)C family germination protein
VKNLHVKNTVRYYILIVLLLSFLFFSNDFGVLDVQKTAIVMAVGIDREDDTFIVTSEIAIPQSSKQGKASETVQLLSRGKTVADAFKEINAKTGWYPKLVFCRLIILGEKAAQSNVFDALDFFLRNEYFSDNCMLATCDGLAADLLNTTALVDPSGSVAMEKVLSTHAQNVGTVLPSTLRAFSIGYFSDSRCGFLPILKTQPQQENINSSSSESSSNENSSNSENEQNTSQNSEQSQQSGDSSQTSSKEQTDKPVFSASETALFVDGKRVETFTKEETFAFSSVINTLKLATYSIEQGDRTCTLNVRNSSPKTKFSVGANKRAYMKIEIVLTAGISDYSKALDIENLSDAGDVPRGVFDLAEKKLKAEILRVYEKCRNSGCDLFGLKERLEKYEKTNFSKLSDSVLDTSVVDVSVHFRGVR